MSAKPGLLPILLATGLVLGLGGRAPVQAASFYVSPQGSDSAPGTITAPFRTVNFAVTRLSAGDTLNLRGGTYFEQVTVTVSGTSGAPIVIQGFPGETAVIDSGPPEFRTVGNNDWELVNATIGEYRSVKTYSSGNVYAYILGIPGYENERVVLVPYKSASAFRATTDVYVDGSTPFYIGPGVFWDSADSRIHVRLRKTDAMRFTEQRYGTVFTTEDPDPRNYPIVLSVAPTTLTVSGSFLTFKNLTVNQAFEPIALTAGVNNVTFDGITAWNGHRTIAAVGSNVHHITITRSRIYGDNPYWTFWTDAKDPPAPADLMRGSAINMALGAHDWEISFNHIRGGHDGVGTNTNEYNISVHHNRIENFKDDAFELEGTVNVGRIEVYENYIGNSLTGLAPGQDSPSFTGPLFVYRNVIVQLRNHPVNRKEGIRTFNGGGRYGFEQMFKHQTGTGDRAKNTHYYHNTLILLNHNGKGLNITPGDPTNTRIANNIMIVVNGLVNGIYRTGTGQVIDGDLYWKANTADTAPLLATFDTVAGFSAATGFEANGIGATPKRGTDPLFATLRIEVVDRSKTVWDLLPTSELLKPSDFLLTPGSPANGAGIVIPPHPTLGTLPDSRTSRDIGAIPSSATAAEYDIFPFIPSGTVAPPDTIAPAAPTGLGAS